MRLHPRPGRRYYRLPVAVEVYKKAVVQPLIRSFRDHTPPAIRHVVETSEVLAVTEPEVFRLAYRYWYDRDLNLVWLDELFAGYLLRGELPGWERSYCTRVLNLADVGQLDPRDFGVDTSPAEPSYGLDQQVMSWLTLGGFLFYLLFLA